MLRSYNCAMKNFPHKKLLFYLNGSSIYIFRGTLYCRSNKKKIWYCCKYVFNYLLMTIDLYTAAPWKCDSQICKYNNVNSKR
jgi:hypothetical protein